LSLALGVALLGAVVLSPSAGAADPARPGYTPGVPQLATIVNGASTAPWNEWQGDPSAGAYGSNGVGSVLPTYATGGVAMGGSPNVSVMPGAASGIDGSAPYPVGSVGAPGPLAGYCGAGGQSTASAGVPARQPAGTKLPLAPAYHPRIVRSADGSLTGYFDYRPKDANEAIEAARSTDEGRTWTYQGEVLEQNPGYCGSSDINDDGNGHPIVLTVGGVTRLYTLQRAAGGLPGVGLLVHRLSPSAANPLNGAPAAEKVGIDPNAFATAATTLTASPSSIAVTSTGAANSPMQLLAGGFVDLTQTPTPTAAAVIACTGVADTALSGCTTAGATINVHPGDLIEQVIGYVAGPATVPPGPNTSTGSGGVAAINVSTTPAATTAGFTNALTGSQFNNLAPNRAYLNGVAVYCSQSNANPTTAMQNCTTGPGGQALSVAKGDPITSDPIIPATATAMTTGLVAPDGIVGTLPSYPGAPSGATVLMYTTKEVGYFQAGVIAAAGTFSSGTISFTPGPWTSQDMPPASAVSVASPVTVTVGATGTPGALVPVTCTGLTVTATYNLSGCTVPAQYRSMGWAKKSAVGAPGATTVAASALAQTGMGSTNSAKLWKNNQDLTILRAAYTTDGVNFSTSGLANGGMISDCMTPTSTTYSGDCASPYSGVTDPLSGANPPNLNAYRPGQADGTEMRWVGSAGSLITNPDGSYGMFLSGAWAGDGDGDAFNQIFYSSSTDGQHWRVPVVLVSTDYTFSPSIAQNQAAAAGVSKPLDISAYYSGRVYGPSVAQNPDGTVTMLFAGYRLPRTIAPVGTTLGTGSTPYTISATDPTAYRNVLVETLTVPPTTGTVSGTVRLPDGGPAGGACVYLYLSGNSSAASYGTCTQADGSYEIRGVAPGRYDVAVADPSGRFTTQWYDGTPAGTARQGDASAVSIALGSNATIDATLVTVPEAGSLTGSIKARVTGRPVGACAYLYRHGDASSAAFATCAHTDGAFEAGGVTPGTYDVAFFDPAGRYRTQWYSGSVEGAVAQIGATAVGVANGQSTRDIDASMRAVDPLGNLTGRLTDPVSRAPLAGVCVYLYPVGEASSASYGTCSRADGTYGIYGVEAGAYNVAISDPSGGHATSWYDGTVAGATSQGGATSVTVADGGETRGGVDAAVATVESGNVTGTVTAEGGAPVAGACVYLYRAGESAAASYATCAGPDGSYGIGGVAPGRYDVAFSDPSGRYATQWASGAAAITVQNANRTLNGIDAVMRIVP